MALLPGDKTRPWHPFRRRSLLLWWRVQPARGAGWSMWSTLFVTHSKSTCDQLLPALYWDASVNHAERREAVLLLFVVKSTPRSRPQFIGKQRKVTFVVATRIANKTTQKGQRQLEENSPSRQLRGLRLNAPTELATCPKIHGLWIGWHVQVTPLAWDLTPTRT
jgi:hypothetical protein